MYLFALVETISILLEDVHKVIKVLCVETVLQTTPRANNSSARVVQTKLGILSRQF